MAAVFSQKAAEGISTEVNSALKTQAEAVARFGHTLQKALAERLMPYLEQIASSTLQSSKSLIRRSDLLWWKQSLYSHRLGTSYRALDPVTLALAMAVDLAEKVSPIHPYSVEFFLKETFRDVLGEEMDAELLLADLLEKLRDRPDDGLLDDLNSTDTGRKPFGVCLAGYVKGQVNANEFFKQSGLDKNTKLSFGELSVWLFHDLQAQDLAKMKERK